MFDWFLSLWSAEWQAFWAYVTGGAHRAFFTSFWLTIAATFLGAFFALVFGLIGAVGLRSQRRLPHLMALGYANMVRGVPDVLLFVFFPLAVDISIKIIRTWLLCEAGTPLFDGINFVGCAASGFLNSPNSVAAFVYKFGVACLAFGLVFGAFAANVIAGALAAVPRAQLETAAAYGFTARQIFWRVHLPQMWIYGWGGLTNIWMLLIKATSLLSLLGILDAVWWASTKLGPPQGRSSVGYVHGDWTAYYFLIVGAFFLLFTFASERTFAMLKRRVGRGMVAG